MRSHPRRQPSGRPALPAGCDGLVVFGDLDWRGIRYSRHQLTIRLAARLPTLTVGRPVEGRLLRSSEARRDGITRVSDNLWSYSPPRFLPRLYRPAAIARALSALRAAHLRRTWNRLGIEHPVYYVFHPDFLEAIRHLPRRFTCYHCYDKYSAYQGVDASRSRSAEDHLIALADLVLSSSSLMAEELSQRSGKEVVHLPHGVDFERFRALSSHAPPPELLAIPTPRIGYVARIDERIDTAALTAIARARRGWSVVLIGPLSFTDPSASEEFDRALAEPNVHYLGPREPDDIPACVTALDIGLLCYRTDNWGRYVHPIKAYEYLACGKPIVSSDIHAARDFHPYVSVARTVDDWVDRIEEALSTAGSADAASRIAFASRNTWDVRASELFDLLAHHLSRVHAEPGPDHVRSRSTES